MDLYENEELVPYNLTWEWLEDDGQTSYLFILRPRPPTKQSSENSEILKLLDEEILPASIKIETAVA